MSRSGSLYVGQAIGGPYLDPISGRESLTTMLVLGWEMRFVVAYEVIAALEYSDEGIGRADGGDGQSRVVVLHGCGTFY